MRFGQLVIKHHVARYLEIRDARTQPAADSVGVQLRAGGADDAGADLLAEMPVGHADHLAQRDCGVRRERLLYLQRAYILAAADYELLAASLERDVAVGIQRAEVAGVHPAVGVQRFRGLCLVAVIALHGEIPAHTDLARLARRQGRASVHVGDLALDVVHEMPHGGALDLDGIVDIAHGQPRSALGLPEAGHEREMTADGVLDIEKILDRVPRPGNNADA